MSDLTDLYQEVILDHSKKPRNFGHLEHPSHRARGDNPLCGDRLDLTLIVRDGKVEDVAFEGSGCAISVASASLMTERVKGRPVEEAEQTFERFHRLLTGDAPAEEFEGLDKLAVFTGVREFPIRVKCATLAWHTLHAALEQGEDGKATVSTE